MEKGNTGAGEDKAVESAEAKEREASSKTAASKAAAAIVLEYMLLIGAESSAELLDRKVSAAAGDEDGDGDDALAEETAGYEKLRERLLGDVGDGTDEGEESLLGAMCAKAMEGRKQKGVKAKEGSKS